MADDNAEPRSDLASEPSMADFLGHGFEAYLALVRRAAAHPENRRGADKTWVERGMWDFQQHYRKAVRRPWTRSAHSLPLSPKPGSASW